MTAPHTPPAPAPNPTGTPRSTSPLSGRLGWGIVAIVAIIALVAVFFIARVVGSSGAPDTPGGLSLETEPGSVTATWESSAGADTYRLIRNDGTVAYTGPETTAVDRAVERGEFSYRVQAVRQGVVSGTGDAQTISVEDGWGRFQPLTTLFPTIIPVGGPFTEGESSVCLSARYNSKREAGPAPNGSGALGTVFFVRCAIESWQRQVGIGWYADDDAVNARYTAYAGNGRPVIWNHGTGAINDETGIGVFRFTDDESRAKVLLVIVRTSYQNDPLAAVNELDL